jgi:hypothetical protein
MAALSGLGEPFRQLRELLKDLLFRNPQERQNGEYDLLQRRFELAEQFAHLSPEARGALLQLPETHRSGRRRRPRAALPEQLEEGHG